MLTQFIQRAVPDKVARVLMLSAALLMSTSAWVNAQEQPMPSSSSSEIIAPLPPLPNAFQNLTRQDALTDNLRLQDSRERSDRQIIRDLIEYPGQEGQLIGIRCTQTEQGQANFGSSRSDSFSTAEGASSTVIVQLQGDCRQVWIQIQTADSFDPAFPDIEDDFDLDDRPQPSSDRSWLTRLGSGWYWLLRR